MKQQLLWMLRAIGDHHRAVTAQRNQLIVRARNAGCTYVEIGKAVGLSSAGVDGIYERETRIQKVSELPCPSPQGRSPGRLDGPR